MSQENLPSTSEANTQSLELVADDFTYKVAQLLLMQEMDNMPGTMLDGAPAMEDTDVKSEAHSSWSPDTGSDGAEDFNRAFEGAKSQIVSFGGPDAFLMHQLELRKQQAAGLESSGQERSTKTRGLGASIASRLFGHR